MTRMHTAIVSVRGPIRTASVSKLHFKIDDAPIEVLMANLLEHENGGWFDKGVRLTVMLPAASVDHAVHTVALLLDLVVPLLAVSAAAEAPTMRIEQVYTDDADVGNGELLRMIVTELPELTLRKIHLYHVEPLFVRIAAGGERLRERATRTLWWYHQAVGQNDPVNRFSLFWTALESLNPLLTEHWGLKPNRRSCPKCDADLGNLPGVYGIDRLLREIPETVHNLFRRARDLRNAIVHGTKQPAELRTEAIALMPAMEAAVPRGLARLLALSEETENSLARPVLPPRQVVSASARIAFTRRGEGHLGTPGFYPHADVTVHTSISFDEHAEPHQVHFRGDVVLRTSDTFTPETLRLTAHVRGSDLEIAPGNTFQVTEPPTQPAHRGHGVTLFEIPKGYIWSPQVTSARA